MAFPTWSQVETPQPSPYQKIEQKVGLADVTLEYSRPSAKGRKIYGELVPFGKMWRTGANNNTKITFSEDVKIGGNTVKAGTYAIYTKPEATKWDVYFYSDSDNWGLPEEWDASKVAAQASVKVAQMPMNIETFTMLFNDLKNDEATLGILWEKTYVGIPIHFNTDTKVTASIEKTMAGNPTAKDYYAAAVYYYDTDKDINQAKVWIDKAMEMNENPAYYQLRQQSLIYAKAGDKQGAIKAAKESLNLSKKAGNTDYVKMNEASLKEWGAM